MKSSMSFALVGGSGCSDEVGELERNSFSRSGLELEFPIGPPL